MAGRRRRWFRRRKRPTKEVKRSFSYKLSNSVTNVSKRCQVSRDTIRPFVKDTLLAAQAGTSHCPYCAVGLTLDSVSFDHAIPISRGGPTWTYPDGHSNLVACCKTCNKTKGALTDAEFLALWAVVRTFDPVAIKDVTTRLRIGGAFFGRFKR